MKQKKFHHLKAATQRINDLNTNNAALLQQFYKTPNSSSNANITQTMKHSLAKITNQIFFSKTKKIQKNQIQSGIEALFFQMHFELFSDAIGIKAFQYLIYHSQNNMLLYVPIFEGNRIKKEYLNTSEIAFELLQQIVKQHNEMNDNNNSSSSVKKLTEKDFSQLLNLSVTQGDMGLAHKILSVQKNAGFEIRGVAYSILLKGYSRQSNPSLHSIDTLLQLFEQSGLDYDTVLVNSAIDAMVRCNNLPRAQHYLQQLIDNQYPNCRVNSRSFNTVLKGFLQLQDDGDDKLQRALDLADKMKSLRLFDAVSLNTLVNLSVRLQRFDIAEELMNDSNNLKIIRSKDLKNELVEAYTALLDGYSKEGELEKALSVIQKMKERGVSPNRVTYTCLVGAYTRAGKIVKAEQIIDFMKRSNSVGVSIITYNTFLTSLLAPDNDDINNSHSHLVEKTDRAIGMIKSMLEAKVKPNANTVNLIIDGLVRCRPGPRMTEALILIQQMEKVGYIQNGDARLYTTLMKGYATERDVNGAKSAMRQIKHVDTAALNAFLNVCYSCGDIRLALDTYSRYCYAEVLVRPDVATFATLVMTLSRSQTSKAASKIQQIYYDMKDNFGVKPDIPLVDRILTTFTRGGSASAIDRSFVLSVLEDAKSLPWEEGEYDSRYNMVKALIVSQYSEVWKEDEEYWGMSYFQKRQEKKAEEEDAFLKSKGWNKVDSGFRLWGSLLKDDPSLSSKEEIVTDAFLKSKGWNDVDSSFRLF